MDWKVTEQLSAPENLRVENNILKWEHPTAERFTVYAYPMGLDWTTAQKTGTYLQGMVYGNELALSQIPNWQAMTLAVCSYDRFGVEHGVAIINEGQFPDSDPNATEITWVLNGGEIKVQVLTTNEELWEQWKPDYVAHYSALYGSKFVPAEDRPIEDVLGFTWINSVGQGLAADFMTHHTNWTWLRDYMLDIADADGYSINSDNDWRYHLYSFFNCSNAAYRVDGYRAGYTADFTNAGKPEAWGPYYGNSGETDMQLPTHVTETYILPTPTHPSGAAFLGWYTTANFTGDAVIAIPAGWVGTLYAKWEGIHTAIEHITTDNTMRIYDIMGRMVGTDKNAIGHGVFIIETNGQRIKIIQ